MMTVLRSPTRMILDAAEKDADRRAINFVDVAPDGSLVEVTRTYGELLERAQAIAAALKAAGMRRGESFAISMANEPEFVDAMIASETAGTIFVPIDPRIAAARLAFMLRHAECKGAIVSPDVLPALLSIRDEVPDLSWIWVTGDGPAPQGAVSLQTVLEGVGDQLQPVTRPLDEPMQMLFTSGTTGDPKAILSPYARFAGVSALNAAIGLRPDDRPYTGLSLTHANAQLISLGNALSMSLELTISRRFTKSRIWQIVKEYNCTTFNLLGGMAPAIFAEPERPSDRSHNVRYALSAGMPASLWRDFETRFGIDIFEFYAAAEGGLTINPPGAGPVGSIGKPPPGQVCKILDEADRECAPGELGQICFQKADGTVDPVSYFKNAEASRAKTEGGWFRSGDVGYKDEDDWVYFSHRAGSSIRRNGNFINADDIIKVLAELQQVDDVYVYGVNTEGCAPGEKEIVAAVVLTDAEALDQDEIFSACAVQLGNNSVPRFLQIVDAIPKTASEKPQERFLLERLMDTIDDVIDRTKI